MLPLGSLCYVLFCVSRYGWGFGNFMKEANEGAGLKVKKWMRPHMTYVIPVVIIALFVIGILDFPFADNFKLIDIIKEIIK